MKIKKIKFILFSAIILSALGTFLLSSTKAHAYVSCGELETFEIASVTAEQYVDINGLTHVPKVMPGDNIQVTVKNHCDTNSIQYNIYIYPASIDMTKADHPSIVAYRKVPNLVLRPSNDYTSNIKIDGTDPGDYKIRVIAYQIGLAGEPALPEIGVHETDLRIATQGIEVTGSTSVVKGTTNPYAIKFFSNSGSKFSIYIDSTDIGNRKVFDIPIPPGDEFAYNGFSWNTTGTPAGSHSIIVQLDNGQVKSFNVEVTEPGGGGSSGSTAAGFSLTKLNGFNIKTLLSSCSTSDLDGITCMVEKVIAWLLDIGAVISFIMILYASVIYLTSYGDESKAELAKKTLIWSVIGVIVIGVAWSIMTIINNILINPGSLK